MVLSLVSWEHGGYFQKTENHQCHRLVDGRVSIQ
ncbi:hypothetical protein O9929_06140 [Vibrio lentus]|nr:hypothetical protein [Vibrio lentus]